MAFLTLANYGQQLTAGLLGFGLLCLNEGIKYKVLSLTYKSLKTGQTSYLGSLLSFPLHRCSWSSSRTLVTFSHLSS